MDLDRRAAATLSRNVAALANDARHPPGDGRAAALSGLELPPGATIAIISAWLHRDPRQHAAPDAYNPGIWTSGPGPESGRLPLRAGPARCPGEDLVGLTAGQAIRVLGRHKWDLLSHRLSPAHRLPATFDHYRIALRRR